MVEDPKSFGLIEIFLNPTFSKIFLNFFPDGNDSAEFNKY